MGFFSRFFGRRDDASEDFPPEDLPVISSGDVGGMGDLMLRITKSQMGKDRSFQMVARATYQGEPVGFAFELGPSWRGDFGKSMGKTLKGVLGGELGDLFAGALGQLSLNQGSVTFRSLGLESDNFIAALSHVYRTTPPGNTMKQSVAFAAISMHGDPAQPEAGPVMMKLFFGDGEESVEVYANFNLRLNTLELREKDTGYRAALLRALTKAGR